MKFVSNAFLGALMLSSTVGSAMEEEKNKKLSYQQLVAAVAKQEKMKPNDWTTFTKNFKNTNLYTTIRDSNQKAEIENHIDILNKYISTARPAIIQLYLESWAPRTGTIALACLAFSCTKHMMPGLLDWIPGAQYSEEATIASGGFWAGQVYDQHPNRIIAKNTNWALNIVENKIEELCKAKLEVLQKRMLEEKHKSDGKLEEQEVKLSRDPQITQNKINNLAPIIRETFSIEQLVSFVGSLRCADHINEKIDGKRCSENTDTFNKLDEQEQIIEIERILQKK